MNHHTNFAYSLASLSHLGWYLIAYPPIFQEAYMLAVTLDEWKRKLEFPTGETVILHNPKVKPNDNVTVKTLIKYMTKPHHDKVFF